MDSQHSEFTYHLINTRSHSMGELVVKYFDSIPLVGIEKKIGGYVITGKSWEIIT